MKSSLPPEAYQLAEQYQLGTPVTMEISPIGCAVSVLIFLLIPTLLIAWVSVFVSYICYELVLKHTWLAFLLFIPVILFILLFILFRMFTELASESFPRSCVYFCKEGLVFLKGKQTLALRWEQIEHVEMRRKVSRYLRIGKTVFVILLKEGDEVVLNSTLGVDLKERINRQLRKYNKQKQQV